MARSDKLSLKDELKKVLEIIEKYTDGILNVNVDAKNWTEELDPGDETVYFVKIEFDDGDGHTYFVEDLFRMKEEIEQKTSLGQADVHTRSVWLYFLKDLYEYYGE